MGGSRQCTPHARPLVLRPRACVASAFCLTLEPGGSTHAAIPFVRSGFSIVFRCACEHQGARHSCAGWHALALFSRRSKILFIKGGHFRCVDLLSNRVAANLWSVSSTR